MDTSEVTIRELSGDVNLTKAQIDETQIIVTTPEKCLSQGFADLNIWIWYGDV